MSNRTDIVVETDNAEGQVLLSASRVYDLTEDKTQDTINSEVGSSLTSLGNTLTQLKTDTFGNINLTGTNNTGAPITTGTFFYNNGVLVRAKTDIQNGSAINIGTNADTVTAGGLNTLKDSFKILQSYVHNSDLACFKTGNVVNLIFRGGTWSCNTAYSAIVDRNGDPISVPDGFKPSLDVMAYDKASNSRIFVSTLGVISSDTVFSEKSVRFTFSYVVV